MTEYKNIIYTTNTSMLCAILKFLDIFLSSSIKSLKVQK